MKPSTGKWIVRILAAWFFIQALWLTLDAAKITVLYGWSKFLSLSGIFLLIKLAILLSLGRALLTFHEAGRWFTALIAGIEAVIQVVQLVLFILIDSPVPSLTFGIWMSSITIQGKPSMIIYASLWLVANVLALVFLRLPSTRALFHEDLPDTPPPAPAPQA